MIWVLTVIVLAAFAVEATLGFGATLVAVTLGAFVVPLNTLLPPFVLLNLGLSAWIVLRDRPHVRWTYLGRKVIPWMVFGVPLGVWAVARLDGALLLHALGVFVLALSLQELLRRRFTAAARRSALPPAASAALLWLGGALHGAFAAGGPLAIYVAGRDLPDKDSFRATLSTLWLLLNGLLAVSYASMGLVTATSVKLVAATGPSLALGIAVGEWAHRRVPVEAFQRLTFTALAAAGLVLALR